MEDFWWRKKRIHPVHSIRCRGLKTLFYINKNLLQLKDTAPYVKRKRNAIVNMDVLETMYK